MLASPVQDHLPGEEEGGGGEEGAAHPDQGDEDQGRGGGVFPGQRSDDYL